MKADLESELYRAIYVGRDEDVIHLCSEFEDGPLHVFTIHNDTPFHKATYIKRFGLAIRLLNDYLPKNLVHSKFIHRNNWGNTLLHNASTSNKGVEVLKKLLQKAPELLQERNNWGETVIFQASRYGRREVFKYLAGEVDKFCRSQEEFDQFHFFQRIILLFFIWLFLQEIMKFVGLDADMADMIARRYPDLCNAGAQDGLTPLTTLASIPKAFKSGTQMGHLEKLIYSCLSAEEQGNQVDEAMGLIRKLQKAISCILSTKSNPCHRWPLVESVRQLKKSHADALKLAKFLIPKDTSWKETYQPLAELKPVIGHHVRNNSDGKQKTSELESEEEITSKCRCFDQQEDDIESGNTSCGCGITNTDEPPLILAARRGCIEMVEAILEQFPQAVEYLNKDGRNVSLVAIKNRNLSVFKLILKRNLDLRSNLRVIDSDGNSILHMVGLREFSVGCKLKSPVLQLSEDLRLLEYLKELCPNYLINHRNAEMKTADELLAFNTEKLRGEAKDWLKRTAEHCTVVIILIATVAFAAAYTVPGGPNQNTGQPILIGQSFFLAFALTDVLSLAFALTAVVVFLGILTSPFELKDFKRTLPTKLLLDFTLLFLSVSMMMVCYAATIILMINDRQQWTQVAVYVAAFFPVCIFVLSYIPVYIQLGYTFTDWVKRVRKSFSRCLFPSRHAAPFEFGLRHSPIHSSRN